MLSRLLNKGNFYKTCAAYWLAQINFACSSTRRSELKVTYENTPITLPCFKNIIFQHHYVMQKNSHCIET